MGYYAVKSKEIQSVFVVTNVVEAGRDCIEGIYHSLESMKDYFADHFLLKIEDDIYRNLTFDEFEELMSREYEMYCIHIEDIL